MPHPNVDCNIHPNANCDMTSTVTSNPHLSPCQIHVNCHITSWCHSWRHCHVTPGPCNRKFHRDTAYKKSFTLANLRLRLPDPMGLFTPTYKSPTSMQSQESHSQSFWCRLWFAIRPRPDKSYISIHKNLTSTAITKVMELKPYLPFLPIPIAIVMWFKKTPFEFYLEYSRSNPIAIVLWSTPNSDFWLR